MAIYHCHIDCYRRSEGRSSVGGLAYRRGIQTKCKVTGKYFNFRRKSEAIYSEFINADCDNRQHDFASIKNLFEEVERTEKHPRATLGRELECALPNELTLNQQITLSKSFISKLKEQAKAENAFFDFTIHAKDGNSHVHIAMSERELEKNGESFKLSKTKRRDWHEKDFVSLTRKIWETETNLALEEAGIKERVDCRTLAEQCVKKIPTLHEGKSRYIKNGDRKMINQQIQLQNSMLQNAQDDEDFLCRIEDAEEKKTDKKTPYQYRLAEEKYRGFDIYGLAYIDTKDPAFVKMVFNDKVQVYDQGDMLTAKGGSHTASATRIVALAHLKGWKSIKLSGSDDFVKEAMLQAHLSGIEIKAVGEKQEQMLKAIKEEYQQEKSLTPTSPPTPITSNNPNEAAFQKHATDLPKIPTLSSLKNKLQRKVEEPLMTPQKRMKM